MANAYKEIINENLKKALENIDNLERNIPGEREDNSLVFRAFGKRCRITYEGIFLDGIKEEGPQGIIISLYLMHIKADEPILEPFRAFRDFQGSMPYHGAFSTHTEAVLIPHTIEIESNKEKIEREFNGDKERGNFREGDFSLLLFPLPKIALFYVFYHADEEFGASVKCLFSNNADQFLPLDALADLGEWTSKRILELIYT